VIHALKFSDMVARIQRALADGIILLLAKCFRKSF
jgi:hypothetical protein